MADDSREEPFRRFRIGAIEVTLLSDGVLEVPAERFPRARLAPLNGSQPSVPIAINAFLIESGGVKYLIDAGSGAGVASSVGHVRTNLLACGTEPDEIGLILMSHLHIDHAGGLLDNGNPVYAGADIFVARAELDYWRNPGFPDAAPDTQRISALVAARVIDRYRHRLRPFAAGTEIAPGIRAVPLPGHTPGHTGFLVASEGDQLFIWGDVVHSTLQLTHPSWSYAADVDRDDAEATRRRVFADAAEKKTLIAGMHLPFPGVGYVARRGGSYVFEPLEGGADRMKMKSRGPKADIRQAGPD